MSEQSRSETKSKQDGLQPKQAPGQEQADVLAPGADAGVLALAAGEDSVERHAQLLGDERIQTAQRQKVAAWLGRTRGNRYLQRVVGPTHAAAAPTAGPSTPVPVPDRAPPAAGQTGQTEQGGQGGQTPTLEEQLREAIEGRGTDENAIFAALSGASAAQRRAVLGNGALLGQLRGELGGGDLRRAAKLLTAGLDTAERARAAAALFDLSAAPAGKIRDAVGLLMLSALAVDGNTARRVLDGDVTAHYIDDLGQPPNVATLVTGYGRDPAVWTLYYQPGTTQMMWVQTNFEGFKILGTTDICGFRRLSLERWQTLLVHETNHARNPDPTTPLENYQGEFRAYWVAEYRGVADLDERARQIKRHVLDSYPPIRAAYDADEAVRQAIDAHTRPDANIINR